MRRESVSRARAVAWLAAALAAALALQGCGSSSSSKPADTVAPVVSASPAGGAYDAPQTVTLTATDEGDANPVIYYTLDGSEPTTASAAFTAPIEIAVTTVLRFFAVDASGNRSAVATERYTILTSEPSEDFAAVAARLDSVLALGYNTVNVTDAFALFFDANPDNDPFLLDTRDAADFAKGHIPGAVNVPLLELPARMLAGTSGIPADKDVIVASYYGGDGNMASFLVNAVRISDPAAPHPRSRAIFMGMMGWSYDAELSNGRRFDDDLGTVRVNRGTETAANPAGAHLYPLWSAGAGSVEEKILRQARAYFARFADQQELQMAPAALAALLDAPDPAAEPPILSVRSGADYARGHIPGAFNIPWQQVAKLNRATGVDPAARTVVYCYTGHTGSIATMALGILGYDVVNLLYGINGWNTSPAVGSGQLANFDAGNRSWDFPVDDGGAGDLGDLAAYAPPANCAGCHTSLGAIFYDRTKNPPAAAVAPPSAGEG